MDDISAITISTNMYNEGFKNGRKDIVNEINEVLISNRHSDEECIKRIENIINREILNRL